MIRPTAAAADTPRVEMAHGPRVIATTNCGSVAAHIARAEAAEAALTAALQRIDLLTTALRMPDADRRQWALSDLVATRGYFNRSDLTRAFGVSEAQAAIDIRRFRQAYPYVVTYNQRAKRYERAPTPPTPETSR